MAKSTQTTFSYEFGGPIGALATMLLLPVVIVLLILWSDLGHITFDTKSLHSTFVSLGGEDIEMYWTCVKVLGGWLSGTVLLTFLLPGQIRSGVKITRSSLPSFSLNYLLNGHLQFWTTLLSLFLGCSLNFKRTVCSAPANSSFFLSWSEPAAVISTSLTYEITFSSPFQTLSQLHTLLFPLSITTIVFSFLFSIFLYVKSFSKNAILAEGGNSGNLIYDLFIGRELNPRLVNDPVSEKTKHNYIFNSLRDFDLKQFCELKPGLIAWVVLDLAMLAKQHQTLGHITGSMILLTLNQSLYVWDALYNEISILTTMDITTDGFGYMLAFGDLAWVPFTYSIQAYYLVKHDPNLSPISLLLIAGLNMLGYKIFRGANTQKDVFRRDPDSEACKEWEYIDTKRGTKLLTSGWWGIARKVNYTGDWLMGLSWCLVCGGGSIVPYFYAIYFTILLVHRSIRDDHFCSVKYGDDWGRYKEKVPYRFVPLIF
ncbi:hypothetical protein TrLO_g9449 [Triparma laevis f. longispina]|uniref:Delta(14)-sterol reductase n=1 Tax=Triparma laevis f. longispina TaxID=1714387 RepID=A0A9W7FSH1_9STRA|nr:hypothetical protein TrLO_g9449 [Triparma laevis f. longispina]